MSVLGTGIAAAVAQTPLQAQQAARQRDRTHDATARDAKRAHELLQLHLRALEEGKEVSPARVRIDEHVPQDSGRDRHRKKQPRRPAAPDAAAQEPEQPPPPPPEGVAPIDPDSPLYRHLDVRA